MSAFDMSDGIVMVVVVVLLGVWRDVPAVPLTTHPLRRELE
jgi:hypothetical protein